MLVSIIVPFYNVEAYFRRCLESIVNQSYQNLEIILVNDCSPDNSIAIAKEYAGKDARITIIEHEQNLGLGGARNSGLNVAQGEYIWFIDSDDEIATPFAVEHLVRTAQRDDSDIILFRAQKKYENHRKASIVADFLYDNEYLFDDPQRLRSSYLNAVLHYYNETISADHEVWIKFFKRSFLHQYDFRFLVHTLYEDLPMSLLFPLAKRITQLPYIFYSYYMREGSIMQSKVPADHIEHFYRIAKEMWRMYDQYWGDWEQRELVIPTLLMLHTLRNTHRIENSLNKQEYEKWLVQVYDFLKDQLAQRGDFSQMEPWPQILTNKKGWQRILQSFHQTLNTRQKQHIMHAVMTRKRFSIKTIAKSVLPFAVVKHMLEKRGWKVDIKFVQT